MEEKNGLWQVVIRVRKTDTNLSVLEAFLEIVENLLALLGVEVESSFVGNVEVENVQEE